MKIYMETQKWNIKLQKTTVGIFLCQEYFYLKASVHNNGDDT